MSWEGERCIFQHSVYVCSPEPFRYVGWELSGVDLDEEEEVIQALADLEKMENVEEEQDQETEVSQPLTIEQHAFKLHTATTEKLLDCLKFLTGQAACQFHTDSSSTLMTSLLSFLSLLLPSLLAPGWPVPGRCRV